MSKVIDKQRIKNLAKELAQLTIDAEKGIVSPEGRDIMEGLTNLITKTLIWVDQQIDKKL